MSLAVIALLYNKTNPSINISPEVTKQEALEKARETVEKQGFILEGYKEVVTFIGQGEREMYLQKAWKEDYSKKLEEFEEISLWGYSIRFFKPQQVEEYNVFIGLRGNVLEFSRRLEENAPGS